MKNHSKELAISLLIAIALIFGVFALVWTIADIASFYRCLNNTSYFTPWYDNTFFKNPYTYTRVMLANPTNYWSKNAVGDDWLIQEATIEDKEFWTVLKKIPKGETK
tara:strand:+ start:21 stop:341 length:321 start_codon:yes stop_codon:yes gene_type:complete